MVWRVFTRTHSHTVLCTTVYSSRQLGLHAIYVSGPVAMASGGEAFGMAPHMSLLRAMRQGEARRGGTGHIMVAAVYLILSDTPLRVPQHASRVQ